MNSYKWLTLVMMFFTILGMCLKINDIGKTKITTVNDVISSFIASIIVSLGIIWLGWR